MTPTLARGSELRRSRGFTLIELLVVVALVAITSAVVSLALRDPAELQLQREAQRLAMLLEAARAESRASGLNVRWIPKGPNRPLGPGEDFRFEGLPSSLQLPTRWLGDPVAVQIDGASALSLGPEPLIPAQQLRLQLGDQQIVLGTDGLSAFDIVNP